MENDFFELLNDRKGSMIVIKSWTSFLDWTVRKGNRLAILVDLYNVNETLDFLSLGMCVSNPDAFSGSLSSPFKAMKNQEILYYEMNHLINQKHQLDLRLELNLRLEPNVSKNQLLIEQHREKIKSSSEKISNMFRQFDLIPAQIFLDGKSMHFWLNREDIILTP